MIRLETGLWKNDLFPVFKSWVPFYTQTLLKEIL